MQAGVGIRYASSTLSLACLEILVHKEPRLPVDYGWVKIEIPAGLIDKPFPLPSAADENLRRKLGINPDPHGRRPVINTPSAIIPAEKKLPDQPPAPGIRGSVIF